MNEGRIATRYAKALLLTLEGKVEEGKKCYQAAENIVPILEELSEELNSMLGNVLLPNEKKVHTIGAIFTRFATELEAYARFMVKSHRGNYLTHSLRIFLDLYRKKHGVVRADIISAVPLPPDQQKSIEKYLRKVFGESLELSHREEAGLIGGFQLKVGDSLCDLSIKGELKAIAAGLEG